MYTVTQSTKTGRYVVREDASGTFYSLDTAKHEAKQRNVARDAALQPFHSVRAYKGRYVSVDCV